MSGRPPPPLPPSAAAPRRTRSTALKRLVEIRRDGDDEARLAVGAGADDGDDSAADLGLGLVGERLQILHVDALDRAGVELDPRDVARGILARAAAAHRQLAPGVGELALQPPAVLDQRVEPLGRLAAARCAAAARSR